jgi:ribosomal protein S18 acetylase RimI-like enzyme
MIAPGRCRPGLADRLAFARALAAAPPPVLLCTRAWLAAWSRRDPPEPHWHVGPLAVVPTARRQGIARSLMLAACRRMDARAATAWLETDLEANVAFYRTLGFAVVARAPVLGLPTWFMRRPPAPPPPAMEPEPPGAV